MPAYILTRNGVVLVDDLLNGGGQTVIQAPIDGKDGDAVGQPISDEEAAASGSGAGG